MTRITTKFSATTTADEVVAGVDLSGKRAIVTGGASGIGIETARSLAVAGAEVTIAIQQPHRRVEAAEDHGGHRQPEVCLAPWTCRSGRVIAFAASLDGPLDLLINNAGVMVIRRGARHRLGGPVRDQSPWAFRAYHGLHAALASRRVRGFLSSIAHIRPGCLRRHPLRAPPYDALAPTDNPRPRMRCLPWRPPGAGPAKASLPTQSCREGSTRTWDGMPPRSKSTSGRPCRG